MRLYKTQYEWSIDRELLCRSVLIKWLATTNNSIYGKHYTAISQMAIYCKWYIKILGEMSPNYIICSLDVMTTNVMKESLDHLQKDI